MRTISTSLIIFYLDGKWNVSITSGFGIIIPTKEDSKHFKKKN